LGFDQDAFLILMLEEDSPLPLAVFDETAQPHLSAVLF